MKFAITRKIKQSKTRPANTTAYAAGDVVATATSSGVSSLTFAGVGSDEDNGRGYITNAMLIDSAVEATAAQMELWLFDTAPAAQNDNVAFNPSAAELTGNLLGIIEFNAHAFDAENRRVYMADPEQLPLQFECASTGSRDIYGVLVVRNAYAPVSGEIFTVVLDIDNNEM